MTKIVETNAIKQIAILTIAACMVLLPVPTAAHAQLFTFSNQDLIDYTAKNPFERSPDGRPKVPEDMIERARGLSSELCWTPLEEKEFHNEYADGFQVLHPGKTLVGRAFTVQFMPESSDLDDVAKAKEKAHSLEQLTNHTAI